MIDATGPADSGGHGENAMIHTAFRIQPTNRLPAVRTRLLSPRVTRVVLCVTTKHILCDAKMTCASDELSQATVY